MFTLAAIGVPSCRRRKQARRPGMAKSIALAVARPLTTRKCSASRAVREDHDVTSCSMRGSAAVTRGLERTPQRDLCCFRAAALEWNGCCRTLLQVRHEETAMKSNLVLGLAL